MLSQKNVLVLGSKSDSVLPDLQVSSIYSALKENLDSNIIVSGIGMVGSGHSYPSEREKIFDHTPRARVDRYLIKRIDNKLKKRIFSLDRKLVKIADVNYWKGNFF